MPGAGYGTLPRVDPELHTVRYAFDAAFQRLCEARDDDALMAELSNALHHLFRLRELCRRRLGDNGFYAVDTSTADLQTARAACWARNFDTHRLYVPAAMENVYPSVYMARYGALVWVPLPSLPRTTDKYGRHLDYARHLDGKELLGTLRRGFVAMADLL
jgi:hypothetical protein